MNRFGFDTGPGLHAPRFLRIILIICTALIVVALLTAYESLRLRGLPPGAFPGPEGNVPWHETEIARAQAYAAMRSQAEQRILDEGLITGIQWRGNSHIVIGDNFHFTGFAALEYQNGMIEEDVLYHAVMQHQLESWALLSLDFGDEAREKILYLDTGW